jgi:Dienelactone hydrolase family
VAHPPCGEAPYETVDERATGFRCRHCRQGFVVPREQSSFAEIFGVDGHIRSICDRLAFEGYTAIAPLCSIANSAGMAALTSVARPGLQDVTLCGGRDYCVLRNSILQE